MGRGSRSGGGGGGRRGDKPGMEEIVGTQEPEPVVEPDLDQQAEPVEFTTPEGLTIRFADPDDEEEVVVVPPPPCQQCGGFMAWWDILGGVHCLDCDPPLRSQRLREQAARIRRGK